ncbi:hypothetical protein GG344DRAFT_65300 [Lentinula edodes]|nr:hypothetical protein GG344DRAFT_65300 [Lentinula edodes]
MELHLTQEVKADLIPVESWLRISLVHAAHTWTEEGGRVFVLVKRLQHSITGVESAKPTSPIVGGVNICWHGRRRDGDVIWACKKLKTLEVSWDKKLKDVNDSCEKWSNVTCESMKIYSNRRAWTKAPAEQDDERQTLIAWIRLFKNTKSLHIQGWIPQFRDADAAQDPLSNTIEELVAPMCFLKLSRCLCNLKLIKVSDVGLKSGEVDETTLSVGRVTTMEVNVFTSDKEILCRLLGALNNIQKLKVHICDDAMDTDDVLESVADMLDFNPPIEKLTITANDTLRTNITHEHFRKYKQLCDGLKHIEIGDRLWTIKQGAWNEQIGEC